MRIALDARSLYAPQQRGIARTLTQLYHALMQIRPDWQVIAYHRDDPVTADRQLPGFSETRCIEMPGDRFSAWLNCRLPLAAWRDAADLLHCPANVCPSRCPIPMVVTIHDLIPLDLPATCTKTQVRQFRRCLRAAASRAAVITCPSAYTANRLTRDHRVRGRCTHVPWGAPPITITAGAHVRHLRAQYQLTRPFVLHFGAADPRKNTHRLLKAWSQLPARTLNRWQLLVVGLHQPALGDLTHWVEQRNLGHTVRLRPFVPAEHVPGLLKDAALLAYPSLSEGFGMPILEAFAARTAVLTSRRTAMPEVAGHAARLVDPTDADAITAALEDLLTCPDKRHNLALRGERRAQTFTWRAAAERFADCLESVASKSRPKAA